MAKHYEGILIGKGLKFAVVVSRFSELITTKLLEGARDALLRHGVAESDIDIVWTPGCLEIPLISKKLAQSDKYDAIVCLGAVIRGGTPHFDYVAGECVKGMATVMLQQEIPVAFGVLTVDTIEQAIERAGTKAGNKGAEATLSVIEMINLLKNID